MKNSEKLMAFWKNQGPPRTMRNRVIGSSDKHPEEPDLGDYYYNTLNRIWYVFTNHGWWSFDL